MTEYLKPKFSVKIGERKPDGCEHSWKRQTKRWGLQCVQCGLTEADERKAAMEKGVREAVHGSDQ